MTFKTSPRTFAERPFPSAPDIGDYEGGPETFANNFIDWLGHSCKTPTIQWQPPAKKWLEKPSTRAPAFFEENDGEQHLCFEDGTRIPVPTIIADRKDQLPSYDEANAVLQDFYGRCAEHAKSVYEEKFPLGTLVSLHETQESSEADTTWFMVPDPFREEASRQPEHACLRARVLKEDPALFGEGTLTRYAMRTAAGVFDAEARSDTRTYVITTRFCPTNDGAPTTISWTIGSGEPKDILDLQQRWPRLMLDLLIALEMYCLDLDAEFYRTNPRPPKD